MFEQKSLDKIDGDYFNIIIADSQDVTIQSRNTGHYWYLHCAGYPTEEALVIFHKHRFKDGYHEHGHARSLRQAIKSIVRHDDYQLNVRMPRRPNIPCKHPGCAALIPHGQMYCEEHKPLHTKDRAHAAERGYGAKWQRERRKFLESNPFCVKCYEEGHITMATVVDHIVPHRGDQKLFWDRGNWQPLCEHHHNVKTMTEDRFKEYRF